MEEFLRLELVFQRSEVISSMWAASQMIKARTLEPGVLLELSLIAFPIIVQI